MTAPTPSAVVDLTAFGSGVAGLGRFLDAEGEGELAAARAAGVAERLLVRHGLPHGPVSGQRATGQRVVARGEELRALERAATVCDPVDVLLHVVPPGRATPSGFDPYRPAFVEALRTVLASPRLRFAGLYLRVAGDTSELRQRCRFGVGIASALQQLPGFTVRTMFVRREGTSGRPIDAAALAEAARREVRLHSAALGSVAPHLYVDAGPDSAPPCHEVVCRVVATSATAVVLDLATDAPGILTGVVRVASRPSSARLVARQLTSAGGGPLGVTVRLPADVRPGDTVAVPMLGRTGLAVPSRYRLATADGAELLAGLRARPAHRPAS